MSRLGPVPVLMAATLFALLLAVALHFNAESNRTAEANYAAHELQRQIQLEAGDGKSIGVK